MPPKYVTGGRRVAPKGYFRSTYDTLTSSENAAVVKSIAAFGVSNPRLFRDNLLWFCAPGSSDANYGAGCCHFPLEQLGGMDSCVGIPSRSALDTRLTSPDNNCDIDETTRR